jgi:D-amino peptidase
MELTLIAHSAVPCKFSGRSIKCAYTALDPPISPIDCTHHTALGMGKEEPMKYLLRVVTLACIVMAGVGAWVSPGYGEPYELSKNDVMDTKALKSADISLFGVKLGDSEAKALDSLVNEKIPGVKVEQEALFIFLLDQRKPTGPMAGVRIQDGKVDLIFINNRFSYKTRGIFRNVLNSESPDDVRKLLGQEDYGDENVMGAILAYDKQGFVINYLGKDVNVEFSPLR